jgi:hypothetical protein
MKERIEELLMEWHPNEIAKMVGLSDSEAKKIVREIYFSWGFTTPDDWTMHHIGDGKYALFTRQGDEWIDEDGEFRCFDHKSDALEHLYVSLKRWNEQVVLNTYS